MGKHSCINCSYRNTGFSRFSDETLAFNDPKVVKRVNNYDSECNCKILNYMGYTVGHAYVQYCANQFEQNSLLLSERTLAFIMAAKTKGSHNTQSTVCLFTDPKVARNDPNFY